MRILYVSGHSVLEYDDLRLLRSLGHDLFSIGYYRLPQQPSGVVLRPPITEPLTDVDFLAHYKSMNVNPRERRLPREFLDLFDCVLIMHHFEFLEANADQLVGRFVVWRSIGQSLARFEERLAPHRHLLKIARASEVEANTPSFCGSDGIVRFYKEPDEWTPSPRKNGRSGNVVTCFSRIKQRAHYSRYEFYEEATARFPRVLYGAENDDLPYAGDLLSWSDLKEAMANASVYFCVHTSPAAYTLNFIEAWMLGAPLVCYGPALVRGENNYEVPSLMQNEREGIIVNTVEEARSSIAQLLKSSEKGDAMGKAGRDKAIELFGADAGRRAWTEFLTA